MKRHANPKPTKAALSAFKRRAREAFPRYAVEFCSHGDLGGHRAPRVRTLAFRLVDDRGKYRSNVVWLSPEHLTSYSADDVRRLVEQASGN